MKKIFFVGSLFLFLSIINVWSQDTIRVLAIGNSFSDDAIEHYLYDLGREDGVTFIIGNLYIGGCSLERHWNNAANDKAEYSYRKIDEKGKKTTTNEVSLQRGITDEKWDYISFQQNSGNSGQFETYFPYLTDLTAYVKKMNTNPNAIFLFHQTWAYATSSTHPEFPKYNSDQMQMYRAIVQSSRKAAKKVGIRKIIPAGTAIQNGRSSFLGDNFNSDGYHLNSLGRYTAACTWFEILSRRSVIGNKFVPSSITQLDAFVAQRAAHRAVQRPFDVTPLHFVVLAK